MCPERTKDWLAGEAVSGEPVSAALGGDFPVMQGKYREIPLNIEVRKVSLPLGVCVIHYFYFSSAD